MKTISLYWQPEPKKSYGGCWALTLHNGVATRTELLRQPSQDDWKTAKEQAEKVVGKQTWIRRKGWNGPVFQVAIEGV